MLRILAQYDTMSDFIILLGQYDLYYTHTHKVAS